MSVEESISVNFGRPMPFFPLDHVALVPQQVLPLQIFEPRYRQLVEHVLDSTGQFAMAVFRGSRWKQEYHGRPPVMPAVCVGQITKHHPLDDGCFYLRLQGICRARIIEELPAQGDHLYREAILEPVGVLQGDEIEATESRLTPLRAHVQASLAEGPLRHLRGALNILKFTENPAVPTTALLELLTATVIDDSKVRYTLLAEGDAETRASIVGDQLQRLERLIQIAEHQTSGEAPPKGCYWN